MADQKIKKSDSAAENENIEKSEVEKTPIESPKGEEAGVEQFDIVPLETLEEEEISLSMMEAELREEVVSLNRVAKVVKGGRRFSFSALVVIGDGQGKVGVGYGKANEVPEAIRKAIESAKKSLKRIVLKGRTLPHSVIGEFGAAQVLIKPASEGTGIIAGTGARTVLELAGVKDVLSKRLGSDNIINVVKATFEGLKSLKDPEEVARLRGKSVKELYRA